MWSSMGWDWTGSLVAFYMGLSFPINGAPVPAQSQPQDACPATPSLCRGTHASCSKGKPSCGEQREMGAPQQRCGLASVSLLEVTFPGCASQLSCLTL